MYSKLVKTLAALGIVAAMGGAISAAYVSNAEAARCYRGPGGWTYCR